MTLSSNDEILSRYNVQTPLDAAWLKTLKDALFDTECDSLRQMLSLMKAADTYEFGRVPAAIELRKKAMEVAPHTFCAQALQRAAIASSLSGRTHDTPLKDDDFFLIWQVCLRSTHSYRDFVPGFSADDIDRILLARTLAAEDLAASNVFADVAKYIKPAFQIEDDVRDDPRRVALYHSLINRLEAAEAATRQNEARRNAAQKTPLEKRKDAMILAQNAQRYFREDDYAVLEAMRRAAGAVKTSGALAAKAHIDAQIDARRKTLLDSVSSIWLDAFVWLLDLPYTSDSLKETLRQEPRLLALTALSVTDRSEVLSDLVRLRAAYPDWRSGRAVTAMDRLDGLARTDGRRETGSAQFNSWTKLSVLAAMLAEEPVQLDDAGLAGLLVTAQDWRPLCQMAVLDSAEHLLQSGPAPRTLTALRALEKRPSHAIIPGKGGPEWEGDLWWNSAPARARALIERYGGNLPPDPNPLSGFVRRLFGR